MSDRQRDSARRVVPASDDEIIGLARVMWNDPALRAIFERVGLHGDMTDAEEAAVDAAIEAYRQGPLWDRDQYHLQLAEGLLRRIVEEEFKELTDPTIPAFLERNRVERSAGVGMRPKPATVDEVIACAQALKADPTVWEMLREAHRDGVEFLSDKPERNYEGTLAEFLRRYQRKYSLMSRGRMPVAVSIARSVASGSFPDVNDPEALDFAKKRLQHYTRTI